MPRWHRERPGAPRGRGPAPGGLWRGRGGFVSPGRAPRPAGDGTGAIPSPVGSSGRRAVMAGALIHLLLVGPKVLCEGREELVSAL